MEVRNWLESLHLEQYSPLLTSNGYSSMNSCHTLTDEDLVNLGISQPLHRSRMLSSLADIHTAEVNQVRGRLYTGEDFGLNKVLNRVGDLQANINNMEQTIQEGDEPPPSYDAQGGDVDLESMLAQLCDFGTRADPPPETASATASGGLGRGMLRASVRNPARQAPLPPGPAPTQPLPPRPSGQGGSPASPSSPAAPASPRTSQPLSIGLDGPTRMRKAGSFDSAAASEPQGGEDTFETRMSRSRSARNITPMEKPAFAGRQLSVRDRTPQEIAERLEHLKKRISTDTNGKVNSAQLEALMAEEKVRIAMEKLAEASVSKDTIKFYFENETTKTLVVESIETAQQICSKLASKNGLMDEPNLQLVENCKSLHIERYLEDHESVTDVFRMWPPESENMLLLRKNPLKYDLFINPARYFSRLLQDDLKDTPTERAEKAKKLLMQEYLKTTVKTPELSGYLYERTGTKKWKRRFFVLRSSGMYISLRGESKESKDLEAYIRFEDRDICTTFDYIKYTKSPTEFCIAFKPRVRRQEVSPDDMRAVCFTSEEELDSWLAGMRLAKFGSRLRENYENTLRTVDKLVEIGAAPADLQQEIQSNAPTVSQAKNSTLIREWKTVRSKNRPGVSAATGVEFESSEEEPDEAPDTHLQRQLSQQAYLLQQQQQQQLQQQQQQQLELERQQMLYQQQQQQQQQQPVRRQFSQNELARSLLPLKFFHGKIPRDVAENYFKERHNEPGLFLLRESQSSPGSYVLSVVVGGPRPYQHFQIHTTPYGFQIGPDGKVFEDMTALIDHHSLENAGLGQLLQRSVFRLSDVLP